MNSVVEHSNSPIKAPKRDVLVETPFRRFLASFFESKVATFALIVLCGWIFNSEID